MVFEQALTVNEIVFFGIFAIDGHEIFPYHFVSVNAGATRPALLSTE